MSSTARCTPEWLTSVLADHLHGAPVAAVDLTPIGTGQVADSYRIGLHYEGRRQGPRSVVAKLPAENELSRATARATRTYEVECAFYRDLAPHLEVRAPACWHVQYDPVSDDFALLLEDLAPARPGDQLVGGTVAEAAAALAELPKLHAPHWGDPGLGALGWLDRRDPAATAGLVRQLYPGFRQRYADRLAGDVLALGDRFVERIEDYLASPGADELTVVHGDFRLDNLLFPPGGGRVGVVDWQCTALGPALADVAYFCGAGLTVGDRRAYESELVRGYCTGLRAAGVAIDADQAWTGYRRYAYGGFLMAVVASQLVERTDRGDAMFVVMAERHGRHALDLRAEDLLAP